MDPITFPKKMSAGGAGGDTNSYWIATLDESLGEYPYDVAVDSSGNVYAAGYTQVPATSDFQDLIVKYNSEGVIQWQKTMGSTSTDRLYGIAVDSSDNIYVVGQHVDGNSKLLLVKFNSLGVIQWQKTLSGSSTEVGYSITIDSSSNVYVSGITNSIGQGNYDWLIAKYNSSGTLQWQRILGSNNNDRAQYQISVDNSSNVYVIGHSYSTSGSAVDLVVAKYNSSGVIQWQKRLASSPASDLGYAIAADSSGNVYVSGYSSSTEGAGSNDILLAKYNSSGTLQWQKLVGLSGSDLAIGLDADSSGYIYVTGNVNQGGYDCVILKLNSSGTIQWSRALGSTSSTDNDFGSSVVSGNSGEIYVTGRKLMSSSNYGAFVAKLPNDGSLTGTYGTWSYASVSLTEVTPTNFTDSTASLTEAAANLTSATPSLTAVTSNLTSSTTTL